MEKKWLLRLPKDLDDWLTLRAAEETVQRGKRVSKNTLIIELTEGAKDRGALRTAAQRHDLIAISLTDPRELSLPAIGLLDLEDAETGRRLVLDTQDPRVRRSYALAAARRRILSDLSHQSRCSQPFERTGQRASPW